MQHQVHVCPNGTTALLSPGSAAHPVISLQIWVRTGSIHEAEHLGAGISHLVEHMVFKGTAEYSGRELNERVPALGGLWNAYTSTDRTVYHIDGPAEHWREFLHLLVELVFRPSFPRDEYDREREVIRREMAMYRDDPQDAAYRALIGTLYTVHPRRLPVIGEPELFDALSYEDMVHYHRSRYTPGNIFICAAGAIDADSFFAAVDSELRDIPACPAPEVNLPAEPRQWGPRLTRREFDQPTTTLMLAWRIPSSSHRDAAPLSLLATVLGQGRSALLYRRFHDELGLAHDISASTIPCRDSEGAFVIEADTDPENRDTLRDALLSYVAELPELDFSEGRERALRQQRAARLRSLATVQGAAAALAMSWHLARNPRCAEEWAAALQNVSPEQMSRAAARHLRPERLSEVSIEPLGTLPPEAPAAADSARLAPDVSELPNGLRLVLNIDRRIPMSWATLTFGAGCGTESADTAGINSLLAECMLKGTASRSAGDIADTAENLGGSISSQAGNNRLSFSIRSLAEDLPALLELLADVILHPCLPEDAVATEKEAMIADIEDDEREPASLALRRIREACFGPVSYGHHPDGSVESVRHLTRDMLLAQHRALICARNAVLTVSGDIDPDTVRQQVSTLFAALPPGQPAHRVATPEQRPGRHRISSDKEQAVCAIAVPGLSAADPDLPVQLLFEEWCRDMAGPIFAEIREKRGLAYYAAATALTGIDAGCIIFYLGTSQQQLPEARQALRDCLEHIARHGMPAEALERSRATVLASRLLSLQNAGRLGAAIGLDTLLGLGADYSEKVPELLRAITPEQINTFIRRALSGPHTELTVCNPGIGEEGERADGSSDDPVADSTVAADGQAAD